MKCVIIDDEPYAILLLKDYIARIPGLTLLQSFTDAISGGEYLRNHKVDLLFADIQMPDISGLDLVRSLPNPPFIIFTTAHRNFAVEGFELAAVDYIVKPIAFDRFQLAIERAEERNKQPSPTEQAAIVVFAEYRMVKIPIDDILYIESVKDYIKIHLRTGKPIMTLMTMKKITELLPTQFFARIHRSFIVGINHIQEINQRKVVLPGNIYLAISDSYADFVQRWKSKY